MPIQISSGAHVAQPRDFFHPEEQHLLPLIHWPEKKKAARDFCEVGLISRPLL